MADTECISYESHSFELLFPSPIIISTFCISYDKTELFIMSLTRLLIYVTLYYLVEENINLEEHRIIKYVLFTMICVNIIYLGFVVAKQTVFSVSNNNSIYGSNMSTSPTDGGVPRTMPYNSNQSAPV